MAWASVGVPNLATVDARVDLSNDQGKVGTTFKHSIPIGGRFPADVAGRLCGHRSARPPPTASSVPLMAAPAAATTPAPTPQIWGNETTVKFDVLTTGTTFGAGIVTASNDPVTHNTFSADQKLYGPLHVTTAVTDFGQTTASKSITAGLKLNWLSRAGVCRAGGAPKPPLPRPTAAQVPCGNLSRSGGVSATVLRLCRGEA